MQITKCLHTAILVSNLEKAEHFYGKVLGLSKVDRTLKYPGAWYQIGDYQIHLIVHSNFSTTLSNTEKWGRNPHFAVAVDNLGEAIALLQSQGYPVQMSASGRSACFTKDPDGNIIEIGQA
ncbi:lactoylglutathione lyase-like lyase [Pleurocapsa sp. PCC 7327]|uniref:VOC family protein n=1 Tax=Pleurocapsa sp. PCC 7327 TaxID=118163 RepID=UPI00029FA31A|nr:VOC family protein [Pleurocapsa sp. PCC 7327]AFY75752.1 lactoylglutathione lyase-like lyase [Pleurocapsa sp. PCC 7327]